MREILFRGKTKPGLIEKRAIWIYGDIAKYSGPCTGKSYHIHDSHNKYYEVFADSVGQYTGLTDKNRRKIFEGDILQLGKDKGVEYLVVIFGQYDEYHVGFYAEAANEADMYRMDLAWWVKERGAYVIGNVFDNPEMLEA